MFGLSDPSPDEGECRSNKKHFVIFSVGPASLLTSDSRKRLRHWKNFRVWATDLIVAMR